ncbi:MAG: hypothetical protein V1753_09260, partial [Pseudomonadota bacterium]
MVSVRLKKKKPLPVLFLGLLLAQIIATSHIYVSNLRLYDDLGLIEKAGYLGVPNHYVGIALQDIKTAFWGGVFFTLTIGAGITLLSIAAFWVWNDLFSCKKYVLISLIGGLAGFVIILNLKGISFFASLYFIAIPLFVFRVRLRSTHYQRAMYKNGVLHAIALTLLGLIWLSEYTPGLFIDFRDTVLLSNRLGEKISEAYYKYTLYPAEAFKSLDQKLLKKCALEGVADLETREKISSLLLAYDYLDIGDSGNADLEVREEENNNLVFIHNGKAVLHTSFAGFAANASSILREFSKKTDRHGVFRIFTFLSLCIALPLLLYFIVYKCILVLVRAVLKHIHSAKREDLIAICICLVIGLSLLVFFHSMRAHKIPIDEVPSALQSSILSDRLGALKTIIKAKKDISDYRYELMLDSPHMPERYWLVQAL